ncbi:LOW QUALITY PROTEIN: hypothetical protein MAR_005748 [Mya arenaria]|uniref:Uncharacterized protein n=1 Tax=Mya arenaria TaxID=6604 RepID=A0ABY7F0D9_MYAAR|nr:LOW QUALITY PROTEIN: hypothetical protein MAR_005748 [Mya arenaria]
MSDSQRWAICKDPAKGGEQLTSTLTVKGSDAINQASKSRNVGIHTSPGELVHQICRKKYTSQQQIAKAINKKRQVDRHVRLRSADEKVFHYDRDCLFCGRLAHVGTKRKSSDWTVFSVRTVGFKYKTQQQTWTSYGRHSSCSPHQGRHVTPHASFSTLKFVSEHARRHQVKPIITFDQPLWWKVLMIICAEPEGSDLNYIVLRLGGFHTEMSFLGAIGHLMAGSGLQEVMELIYATNAVGHMMTGKAISRAVRAHLLVDGVLNAMIASDALDVALPHQHGEPEEVNILPQPREPEDVALPQHHEETEDRSNGKPYIDEVALLYAHVMDGSLPAEEARRADVLLSVKELLRNKTDFLKSSSRTAALCLQYMDMVDILRKFLRTERTGNWALHIAAISEMLLFIAASGHNLLGSMYSKCASYRKNIQLSTGNLKKDTMFRSYYRAGADEEYEEQWWPLKRTSSVGYTIAEYSFKKKDQAITLNIQSSVKIGGVVVQVDPQLLFQRLTVAAKASQDLASVFKYELCSHPPALFDTSLLLRQPQKPVLADTIWALLTPDLPGITGQVCVGWWSTCSTHPMDTWIYIQLHMQYVTRKYGEAIVVFDGYEGTSTKDMTHQRRAGGSTGATVTFDEDMPVTMKKEEFLANSTNKQQFINMLSGHLQKNTCQTFHAPGDADLLIVLKAVESATTRNTVLIGDDTDLLILLIYHTNLDTHDLFFKPEPKKSTKIPRVWNIKVLKQQLGPSLCTHMHAILGCDTTSRLYGICKGAVIKSS